MNLQNLLEKSEEIKSICKSSKIKKLYVFGSTLRGDSTPKSDVDFIAEFDGTQTLFDIIILKQKFEETLHANVDLLTKSSLSKYFRDDVLKEMQPIYEA